MNLNKELLNYLENRILPQYRAFDAGHREEHIYYVMERSIRMARMLNVDVNMALTIAAYHDIGMKISRKNHPIESAKILSADGVLRRWFDEVQIDVMAHAITEHSASYGKVPDTIYGKIVSQADRNFDITLIVYRAYQYGVRNYPEMSFEEQIERIYQYVQSKYGKDGYVRLWIADLEDARKFREIQELVDSKEARMLIERICMKLAKREMYQNVGM